MVLAVAEPSKMLGRYGDELKKVALDSKELVRQVVGTGEAEGDAQAVERGLRRAAHWAMRRGWRGLLRPSEDINSMLSALADLLHLAYLATGSEEVFAAATYVHAGRLALELCDRSREECPDVVRSYIRAGALIIEHRFDDAWAVLGRALARSLQVRPTRDGDDVWAAAFKASYLLEEAPRVDGRLLASWRFYELLETETTTGDEEQDVDVE